MADDKKNENQRDKDLVKSLARAQAALAEALGDPELRDSLVADLSAGRDSPFADLLPDVKAWALDAARDAQKLGTETRLVKDDAKNWAIGALVRRIPHKEDEWSLHFTSNLRRCLPPFKCMRVQSDKIRPAKAAKKAKAHK